MVRQLLLVTMSNTDPRAAQSFLPLNGSAHADIAGLALHLSVHNQNTVCAGATQKSDRVRFLLARALAARKFKRQGCVA
jgi:hypothetical protein